MAYACVIIIHMKIKKILYYLAHPRQIYVRFAVNRINKNAKDYSDKDFIKKKYRIIFGKEINLDNPKTFNEHINWMKLYFREPILGKLVDKIAVRDYVKEKIHDVFNGTSNSHIDLEFRDNELCTTNILNSVINFKKNK